MESALTKRRPGHSLTEEGTFFGNWFGLADNPHYTLGIWLGTQELREGRAEAAEPQGLRTVSA